MENHILKCIGTGTFNFDVITKKYFPEGFKTSKGSTLEIIDQEIGGNCGNVMCELAYYGWQSMPIVYINNTRVGKCMLADLKRFGADTRFVNIDRKNNVKVYKIEHRFDKNGNYSRSHDTLDFTGTHNSMINCKDMGYRDGSYQRFLDGLNFVPDVFFLGNDAASYREIARTLKEKGTLVFFERNNRFDFPKNLKQAEISDIIKFSRQTLPDVSPLDNLSGRHLIIQTLDKDGVRFKLGNDDWVVLPPIINNDVKDPEGAGDWFSSSFINALGTMNILSVDKMNRDNIIKAVEIAQHTASESVSYLGAKGVLYAGVSPKMESNGMSKNDFLGLTVKKVSKPVTKLSDIPEKDYREYDIASSYAYRSNYENICGIERTYDRKEGINPLSNFYNSHLTFMGMDFISAEQLYHYLKFTGNEGIQHDIMQCNKSSDVKHLCQGKEGYADHNRTRWMHMTLALEVKYLQCKVFRDIIRSSGSTPLVEVQDTTPYDVHGATVQGNHPKIKGFYNGHDVSGKYLGMNGCGRCLMAVREKFRDIDVENGYDFNFTTLDEWWNNSPVYKKLLDGMGKNV